jgi:multidrug efflux system membrane fusion protein
VDKDAIVVPSSAVVTGQQGSYVYVVDSGKAHMRPVTLRRQSDSIAVLSAGVKPGDQVVVDGQLRLTDGAKVQVQKQGQEQKEGAT